MIKHFVLFTFEDNFFTEDNYNEYVQAFKTIEKAFDGIKSANVFCNCVDRPANMDLMIEMVLENENVLPQYLNHPEHIRMGSKYNPHVTNRVSFDYKI